MPGLMELFKKSFPKNNVVLADPFSMFFCPPILNDTLKKMGPRYAIASGMALKGLLE